MQKFMSSEKILLGREEGEIGLINPEIKTEIVGMMNFAGTAMIKKEKKRKKEKTSEPESVRRSDDEQINIIFRSRVENS